MSRNRGKKFQKKTPTRKLLNFTFESMGPSKENMQQTVRPFVAFKFFKIGGPQAAALVA